MRDGNFFALIDDGDKFFARMLASIDAASDYILAEFYLVESGSIADRFIAAFIRASKRGVRVRLLFDSFGARALREADRAKLRTGGIDLVFFNVRRLWALPHVLLRDHRKLLIVDGAVGYTGGTGIADMFSPDARPLTYWFDSVVEMRGPVLDDWHELYAHTWHRSAHRNLDVTLRRACLDAGAADPPGERGHLASSAGLGTNELLRSLIRRVRKAKSRVWIATAYFWPSTGLRRALRRAARRGIDVRLLLPGPYTDAPAARSASRLFYSRLLGNGVVIYEYQPRFLHAKMALCDNWASIGSSNFDRFGALWNLDANLEVDSLAFAAQVEHTMLRAFDQSLELRSNTDVVHHWSVPLWQFLARTVLDWSARAVARLRR